jgi:hypothetical protein
MTTRPEAFRPEFLREFSWKYPVRIATVAAGTLASSFENGDTVDGVVLATGDRILLKNQATGSQNGIYVVAASGAPARAYDMDTGLETVGAVVLVLEGTANGGKLFKNTNTGTGTIGTTAVTFAEVTASVADILDIPTAETDDTLVLAPDGAGGVEFRTEAGASDILDIPTAETDTSLVLAPDGAGGVEFRAETGGGGGSGESAPAIIQAKFAGAGISSIVMDNAPANGSTLLLYLDMFSTGTASAVSSTNTTWTKLLTFAGLGGAIYDLWVGQVSGGAGGTTITITHPNSFCSATCLEIADTVTPTLGASLQSAVNPNPYSFRKLAGVGAGNLVVFASGPDNTGAGNGTLLDPSILTHGVTQVVSMRVGYGTGHDLYVGNTQGSQNYGFLIAEIT